MTERGITLGPFSVRRSYVQLLTNIRRAVLVRCGVLDAALTEQA